MNSNKIEQISITKLKDSLDRCSHLKHDIRDNDKTPSWDGEIQVYRSSDFSRNTLLGLARIQVKGTHIKDSFKLERAKATFNVETVDLQNYQADGGVIYFVIQIFDFDNYKIYYNALLPLDLDNWLKVANTQKTIAIDFEELPFRDSTEIERIIFNFLNDRKKQFGSVVMIPDDKTEKAVMLSEFQGFSFGMVGTDDPFDYMLKHPIYIYGDSQFAKVPLHKMRAEEISSTFDMPVKIANQIHYTSVMIKKTDVDEMFCFGGCFELSTTDGSIKFQESGDIESRWAALSFLEHLNRHKKLYIGESYFELDALTLGKGACFRQHFDKITKIREALKYFGVNQALKFQKIDAESDKNIRILIEAYENNGSVSFAKSVAARIYCMEIENLRVLISIEHLHDLTYKLGSGFCSKINNCELRHGDEAVPCSIFCILNQHDFETISNMDYTALLRDLKRHPLQDMYSDKLVWMLLQMLRAYDAVKKAALLDACENLAEYIQNNNDTACIHTLNYLQCAKRKRSLTENEKQMLYDVRSIEKDESIQLGIAILLENKTDITYYYSMLSEGAKYEFLTFPISALSEQLIFFRNESSNPVPKTE